MKKEIFERNLLRDLTENKYIRKMENIIIDEGKRIIDSIGVKYIVVHEKQLTKFLESIPKKYREAFNKHTTWHQIKIMHLYEKHRILNKSQYGIVSTMRQILNKRGNYILRPQEFDHRYYVMKCEWYPKVSKKCPCLRDQCKASECCPHYVKNIETKHDKYKKYFEEYQKNKEKKTTG